MLLVGNLVKVIPINDAIIAYSVLFMILVVLTFLFGMMLVFLSVRVASKAVESNQQKILDKYITSDYQFFIDNKQGELLRGIEILNTEITL